MSEQKIGVFICHCGGNISDYVDVERVRESVEGLPGVRVAKTNMFSCSDAAQEEMISIIKKEGLDGIVIASCSPKLHQNTFRAMAKRAGLNPYKYTQVNIREQCSWTHTHNREEATNKAARLVRAGIQKTLHARALEPIVTKTHPAVLVIGAGIAGMKAAISLSKMGINVHLVEREKEVGGLIRDRESLFPTGQDGRQIVRGLFEKIKAADNINLYLGASVLGKRGSVGDFSVDIRVSNGETVSLSVGAIIVTTGAIPYRPKEGQWGYGRPGIVTLKELLGMISSQKEFKYLRVNGREVETITYIYCVGSRDKEHTYCSRYCCTAAIHTSNLIHEKWPEISQFHLFRDIRTYGNYEEEYKRALSRGSIFIRFSPKTMPEIEFEGERPVVKVSDLLTSKEEIEIESDLICLVTGLEPSPNRELTDILKIPVGKEGFYNEIHPKLRPVETVVDGIFIGGCAQGPKTSQESTISAMAAAAKAGAMILTGSVKMEPFVAEVLSERCDGCGLCEGVCPYGAISIKEESGKKIAIINEALCKGEGACVPICPKEALQIRGYEHETICSMIDALIEGYEDVSS